MLTRQLKARALNVVDRLVPVKPVNRSREEQYQLDRESRRMHLYFCRTCPSSINVRRQCEKLGRAWSKKTLPALMLTAMNSSMAAVRQKCLVCALMALPANNGCTAQPLSSIILKSGSDKRLSGQ